MYNEQMRLGERRPGFLALGTALLTHFRTQRMEEADTPSRWPVLDAHMREN